MNRPALILILIAATLLMTTATPAAAQDTASDYNLQNGENIYRTQCSSCHGPFGEGLSSPALDDSAPMQTYRDFDELVLVTADTMPPSQPGLVTGKDTEDLAAYLATNLDNPVSVPDREATATDETGADETSEETTGDGAEDGGNGSPGFSAILVTTALVATALLARRR